ncbi:MAG: DMT family transporter [Pseudomonadota bacterium]
MNRTMGGAEWAMLITLSLVWGGSFFFNEIALADLPTLTVVVARVGLAAILLHLTVAALGARLPFTLRHWTTFFVMGLLNNAIPFGLIVWGQTAIGAGLAAILNATTPLFTVLVAHLATADEKITPVRFGAVLLGFAGVAVMIGFEVQAGGSAPGAADDGPPSAVWAQLAVLGAAISYAAAGVFGRRFAAGGVAPLAAATGQVTASTLLLAPAALLIDRPWTLPTPGLEAVLALIGVASLSTAFAYALYFRILAAAGATNLLLVTFLVPVSAIWLGVLFLGETLAARHVAGMACIAIALLAIDGRALRALRRRPR